MTFNKPTTMTTNYKLLKSSLHKEASRDIHNQLPLGTRKNVQRNKTKGNITQEIVCERDAIIASTQGQGHDQSQLPAAGKYHHDFLRLSSLQMKNNGKDIN